MQACSIVNLCYLPPLCLEHMTEVVSVTLVLKFLHPVDIRLVLLHLMTTSNVREVLLKISAFYTEIIKFTCSHYK